MLNIIPWNNLQSKQIYWSSSIVLSVFSRLFIKLFTKISTGKPEKSVVSSIIKITLKFNQHNTGNYKDEQHGSPKTGLIQTLGKGKQFPTYSPLLYPKTLVHILCYVNTFTKHSLQQRYLHVLRFENWSRVMFWMLELKQYVLCAPCYQSLDYLFFIVLSVFSRLFIKLFTKISTGKPEKSVVSSGQFVVWLVVLA
jgi:hypothetical protein